MTIYDVLRHLVQTVSWPGGGDMDSRTRRDAALRLIDRLEELSLLGQIAIDVREEEAR